VAFPAPRCRSPDDPTNSRAAQLARGADIGPIGFLFFFIIVVAHETENGTKTLAELFDGRSHLLAYNIVYGPDYEPGACPGARIWLTRASACHKHSRATSQRGAATSTRGGSFAIRP